MTEKMAGETVGDINHDLVDLGRISKLILCILALAGAIAVSICAMRVGLDTRIWPPLCAFIALAFLLAAPVAGLSLLRIDHDSRAALTGPAIAVALVVLLGLSFVGIFGLIIVIAAALPSVARLLYLQRFSPSRHRALGILGFVFLFIGYFIVLAGTRYASFIADFLALTGRASGDVYFHWSVTNGLRYFQRLAIGINGLTDLTYYPMAHILAGRISVLSNSDTGYGFIADRAVVIVPICLAAFSLTALAFDKERRLRPFPIVFWSGILVLIYDSFDNYSFDSESHILGLAFLGLALPALHYAMRPIVSKRLFIAAWFGLILCLALATVTKVTTGFIVLTLIGYVAFRANYRRPVILGILWIVPLAIAYLLFHKVGPTGVVSHQLGSIAGNFQVDENWIFPLEHYSMALIALAALFIWGRRSGGVWQNLRRGNMPLLEILVITIFAATIPALIIPIFGGAFYMTNPQMWVALPMVVAIGYPLLRDGIAALRQDRRPKLLVAAGIVVALSIISFVQFGSFIVLRLAQLTSQESFIRTGDADFFKDRKRKTVIKDLRRSVGYLARADYYYPGALNLPAAKVVNDLRKLRDTENNGLIAYISPQAQDYWNLSDNCFSKSMLIFGLTAVPLIDGLPPLSTHCDQQQVISYGFSLAGKRQSDESLTDEAVCHLARAQGFGTVARIESLAGVDRVVHCQG